MAEAGLGRGPTASQAAGLTLVAARRIIGAVEAAAREQDQRAAEAGVTAFGQRE